MVAIDLIAYISIISGIL